MEKVNKPPSQLSNTSHSIIVDAHCSVDPYETGGINDIARDTALSHVSCGQES